MFFGLNLVSSVRLNVIPRQAVHFDSFALPNIPLSPRLPTKRSTLPAKLFATKVLPGLKNRQGRPTAILLKLLYLSFLPR